MIKVKFIKKCKFLFLKFWNDPISKSFLKFVKIHNPNSSPSHFQMNLGPIRILQY